MCTCHYLLKWVKDVTLLFVLVPPNGAHVRNVHAPECLCLLWYELWSRGVIFKTDRAVVALYNLRHRA